MILTCDKELEAGLQQLEDLVFDLKQDKSTLKRFLKVNHYNAPKAAVALRKSIKWYKDNQVATYLYWKPPKVVEDDYKFEYVGRDRDGHAVFYMPIGAWHTKKVLAQGYQKESLEFRFFILENIMFQIRESQKEKFVMIMDMDQLTYRKCAHYDTIQFLALSFKDFEENYPETLRSCFILNAPWAFSYMYNILKQVFSSKTLSKAKIFDADQSRWMAELLKVIPPQSIPPCYRKYALKIDTNNSH